MGAGLRMTVGELYTRIPEKTKKVVVSLALLSFVFGVGASTIFRAGFDVKIRTDLSVYRAVGVAVLEGKDIYEVRNERTWYFTSPPVVSVLCIPLAFLPLVW